MSMYETCSEPPPPGSLLGSLFVYMAQKRQEAEYFKTRAVIAATLADKVANGEKTLREALDAYRDSLFPFLKGEKKKTALDEKKALQEWTSKILRVKPLWRASDHKSAVSRVKRGAERMRNSEELRKKNPHWRL